MKRTVRIADWKPTKRQIDLVNRVVSSGRLTYGPMSRKFENKFAKLHGKNHAIFMNSGTSALQVALRYYRKKYKWEDGDEVIVPAVTFVATVNVILHERLKPVLVDINPLDYNINPNLIEDALTDSTRAIMPVSLLGLPCQIDTIMKLARKFDLKVIEDCCETMFVNYKGRPVGSRADVAVYSTYLAHIASTGVGGILTTNDKKTEEYMRSLIWHGRDNYYLNMDDYIKDKKQLIQRRFRFDKVGWSYRLTEMEAALGLDELGRGKQIVRKRQQNAKYLSNRLTPFELSGKVRLPWYYDNDNVANAYMFYPIKINSPTSRDDFALFLEKRGIQTRTIMPLTNQPVYKGLFREKDYPIAKLINKQGLLLGCHQFLEKEDLEWIVKAFEDYFYD